MKVTNKLLIIVLAGMIHIACVAEDGDSTPSPSSDAESTSGDADTDGDSDADADSDADSDADGDWEGDPDDGMIPILTGVVMAIPFLFTGSLLLESFFGIPGLGRLTVEAILNNDFRTISAMVFISALLYILANLMTDISYTLVDPRVRLD